MVLWRRRGRKRPKGRRRLLWQRPKAAGHCFGKGRKAAGDCFGKRPKGRRTLLWQRPKAAGGCFGKGRKAAGNCFGMGAAEAGQAMGKALCQEREAEITSPAGGMIKKNRRQAGEAWETAAACGTGRNGRNRIMFVYLDNSATTRQCDQVTQAMVKMMGQDFGNPSSLHRMGITAEKAVKTARKQMALALGAKEEEIYFTSGGTEGDNTAIFGAYEAKKRTGNKIITTQVEHPAVLEPCRRLERLGAQVVYLAVDRYGLVDMEQLEKELDEKTVLITIMHVNNELGTVQPIGEIGRMKRAAEKKWKKSILFHSDAVQSFGKEPICLSQSGGEGPNDCVDLLTVSGHKICGPKGMGALYVKSGLHLPPLLYGGGQEDGLRSGTENIPGIVGLGCAAELLNKNWNERIKGMRETKNRLLEGIREGVPRIRINTPLGREASGGIKEPDSSPSILNVSFLGCRGEVLLHMLEQKEIYVSTGSACSSHKKGSHVLTAAGFSQEEMEGAVRFSLSEENTPEQMDYVVRELAAAVESQRGLRKAFGGSKRQGGRQLTK